MAKHIGYNVKLLHPFESQNHEPAGAVAARMADPTKLIGKVIRSAISNTAIMRGAVRPWVELFFTDGTSIVIQGQFVYPTPEPPDTTPGAMIMAPPQATKSSAGG